MPSILFGAWQKVKMPNILPRIVAIVHEIGPRERERERRAKARFRNSTGSSKMPNSWERECRAKRAFSCSLSLACLLALSACLTNVRIRNYNCGILFKTCDEYTWPTPTPGSACPCPFPSTQTHTHTHKYTLTGSHALESDWIGNAFRFRRSCSVVCALILEGFQYPL